MGDLQSHALDHLKGFTKTFTSNKQDSALEAGCSIEKGNRKGEAPNKQDSALEAGCSGVSVLTAWVTLNLASLHPCVTHRPLQ